MTIFTKVHLTIFISVMVTAPHVRAETFDEAFCRELRPAIEAFNRDAGSKVDAVTVTTGVGILCNTRMVTYSHTVSLASSAMRDGWRQKKEAQWSAMFCERPAWKRAIQSGWIVVDNITLADGVTVRIEASCK